jgi:hypothetical protein
VIHRLDEGTTILRRAYVQLSTERSIGFGCVGPIPWTAINTWCQTSGYTAATRRRIEAVVELVDADYLARVNKTK